MWSPRQRANDLFTENFQLDYARNDGFTGGVDRGRPHACISIDSQPSRYRGEEDAPAAAADRWRAVTRMAAPTRFVATIISVILSANVDTLSTLMIGNTDSTT